MGHSLVGYFWQAGPVVKVVMLILLAASVISWMYILQRAVALKNMTKDIKAFERRFWSGRNLDDLCEYVNKSENEGINAVFKSGLDTYKQATRAENPRAKDVIMSVRRAMNATSVKELEYIDANMNFLATVGSTSPYIGLFGTVWGIMTAFQALGQVQQATIAMVAPGISEALVATALGLFAAIPAVIAYNRYTHYIEKITHRMETFQEEFLVALQHQLRG